ncbi:hypothetical protein [Streptomyces sp. NPDC059928]|uniref:hypothetical protein n=1 Tax=unclassified Streptomyces TaxID=2593676 RepID=UPI0036599AF0
MEAIQVDDFRTHYADQTFWCGIWLGGCGHRLKDKVYTDRACHFAHWPDPEHTSTCSRKAGGVSSADHLYIKKGLLTWMAEQDITAAATIARDADGSIGGEVLFTPAGHHPLHVLLAEPADSPAVGHPAQLILGPGMNHDPNTMLKQGYGNRIRLVPDGTHRRIQVGTERHGSTVDWFELEEVKLTPTGLSTPVVEEIKRLRTARSPIGARTPKTTPPPRLAPRATVDEAHDIPSQDRAAAMAGLEQAINDGHRREIRHWLDRAEQATRSGATADENTLLQAAGDALLRLERAVGLPTPREPSFRESKALKKVERLLENLARQKRLSIPVSVRQRNQLAKEAEQASAWLTAEQRAQVDAFKKAPQPEPAPRRPQKASAPRRLLPAPDASRADHVDAARLADAVRDVLEHAARLGKSVTLSALCTQVQGLGRLTEAEQVNVLRLVKATGGVRSAKPQRPGLLTALITTETGSMHPLYRKLADHAGHHLPEQADTVWSDIVQTLHDRYRTP